MYFFVVLQNRAIFVSDNINLAMTKFDACLYDRDGITIYASESPVLPCDEDGDITADEVLSK